MFSEMPKPGEPQGEPLVIKNQCTGTSRDGDRCNNSAIFGMNVCHMHGGKSPQTISNHKRRLMEAQGDAMRNVVDIANTSQDEAIKLRANLAILDRTGMGPSASLKVGSDESAPWTAWLTNEELQHAYALKDAAIARMDAGEPALGGVREFDIPESLKEVYIPRNGRQAIGDEVIEAVYTETKSEGQSL